MEDSNTKPNGQPDGSLYDVSIPDPPESIAGTQFTLLLEEWGHSVMRAEKARAVSGGQDDTPAVVAADAAEESALAALVAHADAYAAARVAAALCAHQTPPDATEGA